VIELHATPELHTPERSCQPRPDDYDFANLTSFSDESSNEFFEITVQPQIGVIIGSIGAVVGTIACSIIWNKRRNPKIAVVHYPNN